MTLRFLCANHRNFLLQQPDQAVHFSVSAWENAQHYTSQQDWEHALPYVGCAFETAEIVFAAREIEAEDGLNWYMHTLRGLSQTLMHLRRVEDCKLLYTAAISFLKAELEYDPWIKMALILQINRLTQELQRLKRSATQQQGFSSRGKTRNNVISVQFAPA